MMEISKLAKEVQKSLGDKYTVTVKDVVKSNLRLRGLEIAGPDSEISPVIYLGEDDTPESIVKKFWDVMSNYIKSKKAMRDVAFIITDPEKVKSHCAIVLTGDQEYAETRIHKKVADLYAVLCIFIPDKDAEDSYKIDLTPEHMDTYAKSGFTAEDFWNAAFDNMRNGIKIQSLIESSRWISGSALEEPQNLYALRCQDRSREIALIVNNAKAHNVEGQYGASTILLPEVQNWLLNYYGDPCIVLPSSIHEVIVTKYDSEDMTGLLENKMAVMTTNAREVKDPDILSNNIYLLTHRGLALIF